MALIPVDNVGQMGIVKDINAWQLPPNVWTDIKPDIKPFYGLFTPIEPDTTPAV